MKHAIATTARDLHEYRAKITLALLAACMLAAAIYAMNLYAVISKTIALSRVTNETAGLSSQLSSLDAKYLALAGVITPDQMSKYGLETTQVSMYITRPVATAYAGALSTGGHEF